MIVPVEHDTEQILVSRMTSTDEDTSRFTVVTTVTTNSWIANATEGSVTVQVAPDNNRSDLHDGFLAVFFAWRNCFAIFYPSVWQLLGAHTACELFAFKHGHFILFSSSKCLRYILHFLSD